MKGILEDALRMYNVNLMGKVMFFVALICISSAYAQQPKKQSQNINSRKISGWAITIDDPQTRVAPFWQGLLDDRGKLRKKRDFLEISELKLPDTYYPEATFYSRMSEKDSTTTLWLALDAETLLGGEDGEELVDNAIQELMGSIPVAYDRYAMELRIMEVEQAISFQLKQIDGLQSDNVSLDKKLNNSKEERIRLQNALENLELSILATAQRIENNKLAITQGEADLLRIRALLEQYRQQLSEMN